MKVPGSEAVLLESPPCSGGVGGSGGQAPLVVVRWAGGRRTEAPATTGDAGGGAGGAGAADAATAAPADGPRWPNPPAPGAPATLVGSSIPM